MQLALLATEDMVHSHVEEADIPLTEIGQKTNEMFIIIIHTKKIKLHGNAVLDTIGTWIITALDKIN